MKGATRQRARPLCRFTAILLTSAFVGSCAATLDSALEPNTSAFNATAPESVDGETAQAVAGAEGSDQNSNAGEVIEASDPQLPQQVAALPASTPKTDRLAVAESASNELPKAETAATETATEAKPSQTAALDGDSGASAAQQSLETAAPAEKPKGFLAAFFAGSKATKPPAAKQAAAQATEALAASTPAPTQFIENPAPKQILENPAPTAAKGERPLQLASLELPSNKPARASAVAFSDDGEGTGLPGVRQSALFEIKRKSGIDDDSDVDLHEYADGSYQMASVAGMARLAPNGLLKQRDDVDVACLKPSLIRTLKIIERRFGKKAVITSGYRSPNYNRSVRGARNSQHMYCAAVDVVMPGVNKLELANFARSMPGRGGVGTYCHTNAVHIDIGPERDWNWRCRGRR